MAIQVDADRHLFVEGVVYEVAHSPPQFLVKYLMEPPDAPPPPSASAGGGGGGGGGGMTPTQAWLKRPQVRLLLPPWWEEINHPNFSPALTSTPGKLPIFNQCLFRLL